MSDYNRNRPRLQTKSNILRSPFPLRGPSAKILWVVNPYFYLTRSPGRTYPSIFPYSVQNRLALGRDRMITQVEIARRVGLDVSSVNKILNKRQGPVFRKETIRKVFKIARDMGYDFGRLKYAHRRRFPRKEL